MPLPLRSCVWPEGCGLAASWVSVTGGRWIALRSTQAMRFYAAPDLLSGNWRKAGRVTLSALGEPRCEGLAFEPDNSVYLMSEGGGKEQPGTFARLAGSL